MIKIKSFEKNQTLHLIEIASQLPQFAPGASKDIEKDLGNPELQTIIAEKEERVVGFLTFILKGVSAELRWLAIDKNFQGKSAGTFLMKYFLNLMEEKKIKIIEVAVLASTVNFQPFENTRRFYEKFGFKEIRIDNDYYGPGDDRGIMRKEL